MNCAYSLGIHYNYKLLRNCTIILCEVGEGLFPHAVEWETNGRLVTGLFIVGAANQTLAAQRHAPSRDLALTLREKSSTVLAFCKPKAFSSNGALRSV